MKNNPIAYLGKIKTTNPCGEIGGLDTITSVCLLGSLNLTKYVKISDDRRVYFDWDEYTEDINVFLRMLDNTNDLTYSPLPSYQWVIENLRQVGMGINGLGSTLMMLGIPYNSQDAVEFTKRICEIKENITWQTSALLAKEKGTFKAYIKEEFENTEYFKSNRITEETKEMMRKYGVRNAKTTTCPPLGNSSIICDVTSNGIEPVFELEYERKMKLKDWPEGLTSDNVKSTLTHKKENDYEYWCGEYKGINYYYEPHNRGLCKVIVVRDYGYQWLLDNFPKRFIDDTGKITHENWSGIITSKEINIDDHLNIQRMAQYYNNQSTSKTANIPHNYKFSDFKSLYLKAWKIGLNGFTTYRDGCMESVLSGIAKSPERQIVVKDIKLPDQFLLGAAHIIRKEGKKFYIHFSYLPNDAKMEYPIGLWIYTNVKYKPEELKICNVASRKLAQLALSCGIDRKIVNESVEKAKNDYPHNRLGRMTSLCLRHNIPREDILVALMNIDGDNISTLLASVRNFLSKTIVDGTVLKSLKCPECGSELIAISGCKHCKHCNWSACS
jgi:ribonucleoside-diphosphate reductase alpha chain